MKLFEKIRTDRKREIRVCGCRVFSYTVKRRPKADDPVVMARHKGVKVGEGTSFTVHPHPWSQPDFGSEPYLIEIGDNCHLSFGVTFLTHDGCVSTLRQFIPPHKSLFKFGRITIGNNCFIGCQTTILPGVSIGNNCIVGACSVVTKSIPDNEVWAGNPARFIISTPELAKKVAAQAELPESLELLDYVRCMRRG